MNFELLNTKEQFQGLKKGDAILVKWADYFVKHHEKSKNIMFYNVLENRENQQEIICQKKDNHYFNYDMYLEGRSVALEVYKVMEG